MIETVFIKERSFEGFFCSYCMNKSSSKRHRPFWNWSSGFKNRCITANNRSKALSWSKFSWLVNDLLIVILVPWWLFSSFMVRYRDISPHLVFLVMDYTALLGSPPTGGYHPWVTTLPAGMVQRPTRNGMLGQWAMFGATHKGIWFHKTELAPDFSKRDSGKYRNLSLRFVEMCNSQEGSHSKFLDLGPWRT